MRYLSIIAISLLLISCSEDTPNEPTPYPVAPALTLEVLTPAPEIGQPVEFKATVTGATLTAPVYKWDFGDGGMDTTTAATVQHEYSFDRTCTVHVSVADSVANLDVSDSIQVSIVDNRPKWYHWNTAEVTLYGTQHGVEGPWYSAAQPTVRENTRYTIWQTRVENMPWAGTRLSYTNRTTDGPESFTEVLQVSLSPDGSMIDTVYISKYWSFEPGGASRGSSEQMIKGMNLGAYSEVNKSSATYRVDGPKTKDHVIDFTNSSWSHMNSYTSYDSLAVTSDMYLEVRFYNM